MDHPRRRLRLRLCGLRSARPFPVTGEPKGRPYEGGPQWLIFSNRFHVTHIGYGSALWASWHFTCVAPMSRTNPCAKNMRPWRFSDPCPLAQTPVVVCKVSGTPVLGYASHWVWGPRCSATHTSRGFNRRALLALGSRWPSCILVLGQYFRIVRIVVIMRLTILAIAIAPLFVIIRTIMAINSCTSPPSHITHHHGRGRCKCMFLLALFHHTHP